VSAYLVYLTIREHAEMKSNVRLPAGAVANLSELAPAEREEPTAERRASARFVVVGDTSGTRARLPAVVVVDVAERL